MLSEETGHIMIKLIHVSPFKQQELSVGDWVARPKWGSEWPRLDSGSVTGAYINYQGNVHRYSIIHAIEIPYRVGLGD